MSRPAVFLDRDGVLVEEVFYPETGEIEAPLRPEDVRLLPGAAAAARMLAQAGYALVLLSNQAGYAKGKASLRALWLVHQRFVALLAREGVTLDGVFYSYSHPDGIVPYFSGPSLERKPGPYNLIIATAQLDLDLTRSWLVGDRETDLACAEAAGVRPILVENVHTPSRRLVSVFGATNLAAAVATILEHDRGEATLSPIDLRATQR
jgi:D-glycero-D-manno-heptose 1,7-bisphosphate phosphatase